MSHRSARWYVFLSLLVVTSLLAACAIIRKPPFGDRNLYTPIVIDLQGTRVPPKAKRTSVTELISEPQKYKDSFVEVQGLNGGVYEKPTCYPYVGPPTEWLLFGEPISYENGFMVNSSDNIQIQNTFNGWISSSSDPKTGRAIRSTEMKKVVVWGWVRLYHGVVGCVGNDLAGTPLPQPEKDIWYIEAAKLQFLENIEAPQ